MSPKEERGSEPWSLLFGLLCDRGSGWGCEEPPLTRILQKSFQALP